MTNDYNLSSAFKEEVVPASSLFTLYVEINTRTVR